MLERVTVDTAQIPGDGELVLARHGDDWAVQVGGQMLMSSRMHDSEIALAERALDLCEDPASVLVGGLGLGYTLRAVLDRVPDDAEVTVAELVPELVEWNRTHLAELNDQPLEDPRTCVVVGDVYDVIKRAPGRFDAILLDVDNGPSALTQAKNNRLYTDAGVRACRAALAPGGVLAVWSAGVNERYEQRLRRFGFDVELQRVPARVGSPSKHVLFIGVALHDSAQSAGVGRKRSRFSRSR